MENRSNWFNNPDSVADNYRNLDDVTYSEPREKNKKIKKNAADMTAEHPVNDAAPRIPEPSCDTENGNKPDSIYARSERPVPDNAYDDMASDIDESNDLSSRVFTRLNEAYEKKGAVNSAAKAFDMPDIRRAANFTDSHFGTNDSYEYEDAIPATGSGDMRHGLRGDEDMSPPPSFASPPPSRTNSQSPHNLPEPMPSRPVPPPMASRPVPPPKPSRPVPPPKPSRPVSPPKPHVPGPVPPHVPPGPGPVPPHVPPVPGPVPPHVPPGPGPVPPHVPPVPPMPPMPSDQCFSERSLKYGDMIKGFIFEELRDYKYYKLLAQRAPSRKASSTIKKIATDEERHAKRLSDAYYLISGKTYYPEGKIPAPVIISYDDALRKSIRDERDGSEKYSEAAGKTHSDPCLSELFMELSRDEARHSRELWNLSSSRR